MNSEKCACSKDTFEVQTLQFKFIQLYRAVKQRWSKRYPKVNDTKNTQITQHLLTLAFSTLYFLPFASPLCKVDKSTSNLLLTKAFHEHNNHGKHHHIYHIKRYDPNPEGYFNGKFRSICFLYTKIFLHMYFIELFLALGHFR